MAKLANVGARPKVPTLSFLEKLEDNTKEILLSSISNIDYDDESLSEPSKIHSLICNLKANLKQYEAASVNLSTRLWDQGSRQRSQEVRNERLKIVYTECRSVIKNLNKILEEKGQQPASTIGSHATSALGAKVENRPPKVDAPISILKPCVNVPSVILNTPSEDPQALVNDPNPDEHIMESASAISRLNFQEHLGAPSRPEASLENIEVLDPFSKQQLKQSLLKGLGEPFNGEPERYWSWSREMRFRLLEAGVGPLDSLYILQSNSSGRPKKIVSQYISIGSHNPSVTLNNVWNELKKRFGSNVLVSNSLLSRLSQFKPIKSPSHITEMEDLKDLLQLIIANMEMCSELKILNLQRGMKSVWEKFPEQFQRVWRTKSTQFTRRTNEDPNLDFFVKVINEYIDECSNPNFLPTQSARNEGPKRYSSTTLQTSTEDKKNVEKNGTSSCVYHNKSGHHITQCMAFKALPYKDRQKFASDAKLCYNCLESHRRSDCKSRKTCEKCDRKHHTILHCDQSEWEQIQKSQLNDIQSNCISVCGNSSSHIICSKTLLVKVKVSGSGQSELTCLCILDEHSDTSFCDPRLVEHFKLLETSQVGTFNITTINGTSTKKVCPIVQGIQIRGVKESSWIDLPPLVTIDHIPTSKRGIATNRIVSSHPHLRQYAKNFPMIRDEHQILLLVGSNCGAAMQTTCYGDTYPYAHHTALGWSLVGPICERSSTLPNNVSVLMSSCEQLSAKFTFDNVERKGVTMAENLFSEKPGDNLLDLSKDDQRFIDIIGSNIKVNDKGMLEMPLPLKETVTFPENKKPVFRRTLNTLMRVKRDQTYIDKCLEIMEKYLENDQVEELHVGEAEMSITANYIPIFPIKQKKGKVRLVFDASAKYQGRSLNDNLLQGPDENNKVTSVLLRFRHGQVGFSSDVQCMFHCFYVSPEHRNLLRFFWFAKNDARNPLVPYRAKVHIFGLKSSPAVATFGLRHCTKSEHAVSFPEACNLICKNTYVDDMFGSSDTVGNAIQALGSARNILNKYNITLHRINSNNSELLHQLSPGALSTQEADISLNMHEEHHPKTLGIMWNLSCDQFVIKCSIPARPFTRRGIVSMTNSIFDPLGFISPIILQGRLLQRQFLSGSKSYDWDERLPDSFESIWSKWLYQVSAASTIFIPRCFTPPNFGEIMLRELHVFADASDDAVGHVMYLKSVSKAGDIHVSFVCGSSKVAPQAATSMPRLELCACVDAALSARKVCNEIDINIDIIKMYTDSQVVLGYLSNTKKQFSKYVTARVTCILREFEFSHWVYVQSKENPADLASRPQSVESLKNSIWFSGPKFLYNVENVHTDNRSVTAEFLSLPEEIHESNVHKCITNNVCSFVDVLCRAQSCLSKVERIINYVVKFCRTYLKKPDLYPEFDVFLKC